MAVHLPVKVAALTIAFNLILTAVKLVAGIWAHSEALISDALHSASDVLSTLIVIIGIRISAVAADEAHPYGHERLECVAAIILAGLLLLTGLFIGFDSYQKINLEQGKPGLIAVIAAIISIVVKELMYRYTRYYARLFNSDALTADAWHHRSDALSSVGALIGIVGARLGLPVLDPLAGLVICIFIVKVAADIFRDAVEKLVDHNCDADFEKALKELIAAHEEVDSIDDLKTREFGNRVYIELELSVDGSLTLSAAHAIAHRVHDDIERSFPQVKHVMILSYRADLSPRSTKIAFLSASSS